MTSDIATRVARGVALLDERKPGWAGQIDLITLDVANPDMCVLGQLYPDHSSCFPDGFNAGLDDLDLHEGFTHGVDCYPYDLIVEQRVDYYKLTQEWRRVIEILRQRQASEVEALETVAA